MKSVCLALISIPFLLISCSTSDDVAPQEELNLEIGDYHQGGIIFYLDETGEHGLIAAENDLESAEWGCTGNYEPIAQGQAIGTGAENTAAIVAFCDEEVFAAKLCADLEIDGYNDWFLPSIDEIALVHENRELIGGFPTGDEIYVYHSSTEGLASGDGNGGVFYLWNYTYDFSIEAVYDDRKTTSSKSTPDRIRAVRAF